MKTAQIRERPIGIASRAKTKRAWFSPLRPGHMEARVRNAGTTWELSLSFLKVVGKGGEFWQVLSWGCARTLELGRSGAQQEKDVSSFGFDTREPKKRKAAAKKIDVHAELDALSYAARRGVAIDGATAYVTRPPCNRCLPALIAAGVTRVVYSDTICRHTSAENAERQLRIASECGVQLVQDVPPVPHEYAKYGDWLRGKETRLSVRSEFRRAG